MPINDASFTGGFGELISFYYAMQVQNSSPPPPKYPPHWRQGPSSMQGLGLTMEAIDNDPVMYDLMMENVWTGEVGTSDLDAWLRRYVERRYGVSPSATSSNSTLSVRRCAEMLFDGCGSSLGKGNLSCDCECHGHRQKHRGCSEVNVIRVCVVLRARACNPCTRRGTCFNAPCTPAPRSSKGPPAASSPCGPM